MEDKQPEEKPSLGKVKKTVSLLALEAGTEFAFLIAVPMIGGIWAGKWLDAKTGQHYFVILGILFGLSLTCLSIYKRIKDYKSLLK